MKCLIEEIIPYFSEYFLPKTKINGIIYKKTYALAIGRSGRF